MGRALINVLNRNRGRWKPCRLDLKGETVIDKISGALETAGSKLYWEIADHFPVASASDEFFYFPQVKAKTPDWTVWDRFSPEFVSEFARRLSSWENEIDRLISKIEPQAPDLYAQAGLLKKVVRTLKAQLEEVRAWETQPSFYLAIACIGLAEALEKGMFEAGQRAATLGKFLDQGADNLKNVPDCFQDVGLEMARDTRAYLMMLLEKFPQLSDALASLDRFEGKLKTASVDSGFRMPKEMLTCIIEDHINCGMGVSAAEEVLDHEIDTMNRVLDSEAKAMGHDTWQEAYPGIRVPEVGEAGLVELYRQEVQRLGGHCLKSGLVNESVYHANPVRVMPVPDFLKAIRAASSYSIPPGHPPSGGVFYVINARDPEEAKKPYNKEYRILCAHETWPGHHLLDISRWNLPFPVLRAVEQPIFYEGWACFAEEMLTVTGYISEPADRLIVAKRRLWRAIRGKVDLGMQTGSLTLEGARDLLVETGMTRDAAAASARKYLLNPGYQLCYTLGLRHFLDLYRRYGRSDLQRFSNIVLRYGEIAFKDLERIFAAEQAGINR